MKKFLAIVLFSVFAFQVVSPVAFTACFYANRAVIASKYCENKARPMLHCDGQCFLAKKLQAFEAKKSPTESQPVQNVWVESAPCILMENLLTLCQIETAQGDFPIMPALTYRYSFAQNLLRPPLPLAA